MLCAQSLHKQRIQTVNIKKGMNDESNLLRAIWKRRSVMLLFSDKWKLSDDIVRLNAWVITAGFLCLNRCLGNISE
jgi:hypothetical protein